MKILFSLKSKVVLTGAFLLSIVSGFTQDYAIESIPEELLKDTDAVTRLHKVEFEVIDRGHGIKRSKEVTTLLNSKAKNLRNFVLGYDDMRQIKSIGLKVYDAKGSLIEKYKAKDFDDYSAYDGFSVFSDNRLKALSISKTNYPYTVEFEYERYFDGLMFYPDHYFNSTYSSVEHSSFIVRIPSDLDFQYKTQNSVEPEVVSSEDYKSYKWVHENLQKIKQEPYGPPISEQYVRVDTSPNEFEFGGYNGRMDSWDALAEFQRQLSNDLDPLPQTTKQVIQELTKNAKTVNEKIGLVYEHLQNNFRYVSVQLGIGGWQPFSPAFVDESGYGDCKALSYYTKTMLESIGIPANYTLISAGRSHNTLDPQFPTSNFNHVVLCVPNEGDTIWLECTSQTNPLGYSGYFTGNRKALMVTEDEGIIVETPKYGLEDNQQNRKAYVKVNLDGQLEIDLTTVYTGLQFENDNLNNVVNQTREDQSEWLYEKIDLPDISVEDFNFSQKRLKIPEAKVEVQLTSDRYVSKSGNRFILQGNLLNRLSYVPPKVDERKTDVAFSNSFADSDSIWFDIPSSALVEFLPEKQEIKSDFGAYSSGYLKQENQILYYRNITYLEGRFSPDKYEELREFRKAVSNADKQKMVLKLTE